MSMSTLKKFSLFRTAWQRSFFVTLFFVTLAALLFWLDTFRVYQAEIRVLVIGKTPSVATDQVVENMTELSKNLSFYERVLAGSDLIDDDFEGYSKDERKALWNQTVAVKQNGKSGVLSVVAKQDTPEKAKRLSEETVKTLFAVSALYYNIKTDIDLRVIDESIVKTVIDRPVSYALTSFGSALALTLSFFALLSIPTIFGKRGQAVAPEFPIGASVPFIDPQKFIPARPATLSFESSHEEQTKETAAPRVNGSERMLPGMDATELPFQLEESYPEEREEEAGLTDLPLTGGVVGGGASAVVETVEEAPVKKGEPTPEEYKRRLNELLSGGK